MTMKTHRLDMVGMADIMYFESAQERYSFILDNEDLPGITLTALAVVEDGETESYPLEIQFDAGAAAEAEAALTQTKIDNLPF